ncbi:MAG: aldehyde ferredoxin oxidoreductase N-terminal domain-containing protein, partial [Thermoplasmata archaeon]
MKGANGKYLYIDLKNENFEKREIDNYTVRRYLGGLGLGAYFLYREVKKGIDPFDENNVLIISPGLLVSSGLPTASKTVFVSKSPLTGGIGKAVAGATIGPEIRKAGYDLILIKGKAKKHSIIVIKDDEVKIESTDLWGKDTRETQLRIKEKYPGFATAA